MPYSQRPVAKSRPALIPRLKSELAALRVMAAARHIQWHLERKYGPDQPRVPAGNADGGQWTRVGGGWGSPTRDRAPSRPTTIERWALTPNEYGVAVHVAVDHYFKLNYPVFNPLSLQFDTEFSVRKGTGSAYYATRYGAAGSKRFDAYEDVGYGTVCGYDIKTGPRGLTPRRIAELRSAARGYYKFRNNGLEPKRVLILEVRPWR